MKNSRMHSFRAHSKRCQLEANELKRVCEPFVHLVD